MASTRNKNTPINYNLEQGAYRSYRQQLLYHNSSNGEAYTTQFAGNGLIQGPMPWNKLSHNAADVESFLLGIDSTNLVKPKGAFVPEIAYISSAHIFEKPIVYMPDPLVVERFQRPLAP